MTDGLALLVLTVFPGIAKKTLTMPFPLSSLLKTCMVFFQISRQRLLEGPFSSVYSLSEKI